MSMALLFEAAQRLPGFPPLGFSIALVDFAFMVICVHFASLYYKHENFFAWLMFILFGLLALLFFIAWLLDLGAHL